MATDKLTNQSIERLRPKEKPYKATDGGGLFLLVNPVKPSLPKGSKLWRLKYNFGRNDQGKPKQKQLAFGAFPEISLDEARRLRNRARATLREGLDPGLSRKLRTENEVITFEAISLAWHEVNKGRWDDRHSKDILRSLDRLVFPALKGQAIGSLKAPVVYDLIKDVQEKHGAETARRIRQRMSAIFVEAIARGLRQDDPAAAIKSALPPGKKGQMPAVTTLEDAWAVLTKVEAMEAKPVTKLAHRFLALTVVRPANVNGARWDEMELDGDEPLWVIPADRMKMDLEHIVPLSAEAVEILETIRPLTGKSPYVFPNDRWHHRPASENMMNVALRRAGFSGKHVPHGWRATFSTIMNELFPNDSDPIERVLAHTEKNKVRRAYNRAKYLDRRRELLAEWAGLLLKGAVPTKDLLYGLRRPGRVQK